MTEPPNKPLLLLLVGNRPLVICQCDDNRRETQAETLPTGRPGSADCQIGLGHQRSQGWQIAMQINVRVADCLLTNRLRARTTRWEHHINVNIWPIKTQKGSQGSAREILLVGSTHENEHSSDRPATSGNAIMKFGINGLQQGVPNAQQDGTRRGHPANIAGGTLPNQVLIKQQLAVVHPVGQIVKNHDAVDRCAQCALPSLVDVVVVDDKPIGLCPRVANGRTGLLNVFLPRGCQVNRLSEVVSVVRYCTGCGQSTDAEATFLDQVAKVAIMLTADKRYRCTVLAQSTCQRQAAHHMAGSNCKRCIRANNDPRLGRARSTFT